MRLLDVVEYCPSQCAVGVTLEDGRVTGATGDLEHPFTQGVVCGKVHDYAERLYAPTRVLTLTEDTRTGVVVVEGIWWSTDLPLDRPRLHRVPLSVSGLAERPRRAARGQPRWQTLRMLVAMFSRAVWVYWRELEPAIPGATTAESRRSS